MHKDFNILWAQVVVVGIWCLLIELIKPMVSHQILQCWMNCCPSSGSTGSSNGPAFLRSGGEPSAWEAGQTHWTGSRQWLPDLRRISGQSRRAERRVSHESTSTESLSWEFAAVFSSWFFHMTFPMLSRTPALANICFRGSQSSWCLLKLYLFLCLRKSQRRYVCLCVWVCVCVCVCVCSLSTAKLAAGQPKHLLFEVQPGSDATALWKVAVRVLCTKVRERPPSESDIVPEM